MLHTNLDRLSGIWAELESYYTPQEWNRQGVQGELPAEQDASRPENQTRITELRLLINKLSGLNQRYPEDKPIFVPQGQIDTSVLRAELDLYHTPNSWDRQGMQGPLPAELDATTPKNRERMEELRTLISDLTVLPQVHAKHSSETRSPWILAR